MAIPNYSEFTDHVRDALTHLYDHVHLQTHPLNLLLTGQAELDEVSRSQRLRRRLLEAVEQLNPAAGRPVSSEATFSYSALCYRYLDGLSPEEIANILGLSPRQVYRKLREAVEAVASLLWDQLQQELAAVEQAPAPPDTWDRRSLAQATVQQLGALAHPEMLEIGSLMAGILKDLLPYCAQMGAEIVLPPAETSFHIYGDRAIFRQAMINLLTNALDQVHPPIFRVEFAPAPGRLHLTLHAPDSQHAAVPIEKREGIGWQVGVQLIEMQGGRVSLVSPADGWSIQIELPLVEPQRVLVIDDMPDIADLFRRFTTHYALEVIGAKSAAEAFEVLQNLSPALILLDVMLPKQDGWEILQTLKANPATATIPVIICSILNEPGLATSIGADGYLRKPVSQEMLLQELIRWLRLAPAPAAGLP